MTYEVLSVIKYLNRRIKEEEEMLATLRDNLQRLTNEIDGMPHAHNNTSTSAALTAEIIDQENIIRKLQLIRAECRAELIHLIGMEVADPLQRSVLIEHDVFGLSYSEIASKLNYSRVHVYRARRNALSSILER